MTTAVIVNAGGGYYTGMRQAYFDDDSGWENTLVSPVFSNDYRKALVFSDVRSARKSLDRLHKRFPMFVGKPWLAVVS